MDEVQKSRFLDVARHSATPTGGQTAAELLLRRIKRSDSLEYEQQFFTRTQVLWDLCPWSNSYFRSWGRFVEAAAKYFSKKVLAKA
jgi:hypothetical protein